MAIRRTKKQKEQVALKRELDVAYSLPTVSTVSKNKTTISQKFQASGLGTDPKMVKKDLFKTLIVTTIVVIILLSIVWFDVR